jgi:uroporphyrinogen-III synthase
MALIPRGQELQALVTRPREEAEALSKMLADRGVAALIEPMMQIRFRSITPDLAGVQAVLCTSANGVRALARATAERAIPILAVGDTTAARARAEGFARVASAGGNAGDLVRLAADRLRPRDGRLLHICGNIAAGDLVGELGALGFEVERSVLYEAQPISGLSIAATDALSAHEVDFALFFSPRTAAIFVKLAKAAGVAARCHTVTALSISAAADAMLGALPWRARQIAERMDQPALLDLLDRVLGARWRG